MNRQVRRLPPLQNFNGARGPAPRLSSQMVSSMMQAGNNALTPDSRNAFVLTDDVYWAIRIDQLHGWFDSNVASRALTKLDNLFSRIRRLKQKLELESPSSAEWHDIRDEINSVTSTVEQVCTLLYGTTLTDDSSSTSAWQYAIENHAQRQALNDSRGTLELNYGRQEIRPTTIAPLKIAIENPASVSTGWSPTELADLRRLIVHVEGEYRLLRNNQQRCADQRQSMMRARRSDKIRQDNNIRARFREVSEKIRNAQVDVRWRDSIPALPDIHRQ